MEVKPTSGQEVIEFAHKVPYRHTRSQARMLIESAIKRVFGRVKVPVKQESLRKIDQAVRFHIKKINEATSRVNPTCLEGSMHGVEAIALRFDGHSLEALGWIADAHSVRSIEGERVAAEEKASSLEGVVVDRLEQEARAEEWDRLFPSETIFYTASVTTGGRVKAETSTPASECTHGLGISIVPGRAFYLGEGKFEIMNYEMIKATSKTSPEHARKMAEVYTSKSYDPIENLPFEVFDPETREMIGVAEYSFDYECIDPESFKEG